MSIEETIAANKLIAMFMGAWIHQYGKRRERYVFNDDRGSIRLSVTCEHLKYHKSWDWLMPVCEKINSIDNQADELLVSKLEKANLEILRTSILCHKEEVYRRVLAFIRWYNRQTLNLEIYDTSGSIS